MSDHRIVSLLPSATEIVCALGFEDQLVGRSHECDFPPTVKRIPICSQPRIDVNGSSREIDECVKQSVENALSVYKVDRKRLLQLQPTLIITQTQCEVCAVSLADVEMAVCQMVDSSPRIVALAPNGLTDVGLDIIRIAESLGVREQSEEFVGEMFGQMAAISANLEMRKIELRPTIACIEWIDPLMAAGNWVPELVAIAGGTNLFGETGKHSPWMSWVDLAASDPDVIAVMPCGFDIKRTRSEMPSLTGLPEWRALNAVSNNRVFLTDGNQYFNRPGPRLADSARILAEILHSDVFPPKYEGLGWERL